MTKTTRDAPDFASPVLPFTPTRPPLCRASALKRFPDASVEVIDPLASIWDEVIHRIISEMLQLSRDDTEPLHIDIREDMVLELAQLQLWLAERVIEKRTEGSNLADIDADQEREGCLGPAGAPIISGTAKLAYEHIWKRKMDERWKPKSAKAVEREKNPRQTKLAVKPVGKNHFIPRWFIRDKWATEGKVMRWRRTAAGWTASTRSFGKWGYRHKLYSDRLEAYFGLLEGDAKRPIEMLLATEPLNRSQREALVGFLMIQLLRNPYFIDGMHQAIAPVIAEQGLGDDPEMPRKAYETLFSDNDFYGRLANPIMASRWAIVTAPSPVFVLPDTFGIRGDVGKGLRLIAPLTPTKCFATLPEMEEQKRIVPYHLPADERLSGRISAALVAGSAREFLSQNEFVPPDFPAPPFPELLKEIAKAVDAHGADERARG